MCLLFLLLLGGVQGLLVAGGPVRRRRTPTTMIISPEAMVSLQKLVNKKGFEKTVSAYAKEKRISPEAAELEYAKYLMDPDGFVLEKADRAMRPTYAVKKAQPGQRRSPLLQAYIDEGGDEVRERIENFERQSTTKALVIIGILATALIGKDFLPPDLLP